MHQLGMFHQLSAFLMGQAAPPQRINVIGQKELEALAPFEGEPGWWDSTSASFEATGCCRANWPHGAKVKKPCDTSTQLSNKLTRKTKKIAPAGKFSTPYIPFFFCKLDKYEGLWGQDTTESDSEVALNICLRVWRQVCLRTTLISLSCLDWTFEFSQQCFAVAQFLVLFIGENKCGSSPSKEVFKALHGRHLNWVQDVW